MKVSMTLKVAKAATITIRSSNSTSIKSCLYLFFSDVGVNKSQIPNR